MIESKPQKQDRQFSGKTTPKIKTKNKEKCCSLEQLEPEQGYTGYQYRCRDHGTVIYTLFKIDVGEESYKCFQQQHNK